MESRNCPKTADTLAGVCTSCYSPEVAQCDSCNASHSCAHKAQKLWIVCSFMCAADLVQSVDRHDKQGKTLCSEMMTVAAVCMLCITNLLAITVEPSAVWCRCMSTWCLIVHSIQAYAACQECGNAASGLDRPAKLSLSHLGRCALLHTITTPICVHRPS